ncbi:MAG: proliferating cell nuclear antigen (pcna) [Candidatus Helarchaeota archaeon]
MFKLTPQNPGNFIKIIDALATIIDVATLKISNDGLSVKAMDPSHVAMVDLEMPPEAFEDLKSDGTSLLRINLTDLNRFMKRGVGSETIELSLDQKQNKLKILFKKGKSRRTFKLGLITEDEEEELPNPKLDLNAKFTLDTDDFQRAIKDAQIIGDFINFTISDNVLILEASGDSGDVTIEFEDLVDLSTKGKETALYSLEYLVDIIKASSVSNTVSVEFSTEMPIKFKFQLDPGQLTYLLAPRVETEEEEVDYDNIGAEEDEVDFSADEDSSNNENNFE